jgi:hypothetical protein
MDLVPVQLSAAQVPARAMPGGSLSITLTWRVLDRPSGDYSVGLRLIDKDSRATTTDDRTLIGGPDPVRAWRAGQVVTTTHTLTLPTDALGRYTLRVSLYSGDQGYRYFDPAGDPGADIVRPIAVKPDRLTHTNLPPSGVPAWFAQNFYLLQVEARPPEKPGEAFEVTTSWSAGQTPPTDYTIFAHLVGPDGKLLAQQDQQPAQGRYPTGIWDPGEVVSETLRITLPPGLSGQTTCLRLGLYDRTTLARLARQDAAGDFWQGPQCWTLP